jgi:uncharacterized protein with HEPN domain
MSEIDWELIEGVLQKVQKALMTIEKRFRQVPNVDFFQTEEGQEKLDGICMLFEATGEAFQQIDKFSHKSFLPNYPEIDWKKIIGFRNIIAHNYFDIDEEAVFNNCRNHLPPLLATVERMINDLQANLAQE